MSPPPNDSIEKPNRGSRRAGGWLWVAVLLLLAAVTWTSVSPTPDNNAGAPTPKVGVQVLLFLFAPLALLLLWIGWLLFRAGTFTWIRLAGKPAQLRILGDEAGAERALATALARARRFAPGDRRRGQMLVVLAGFVKNQGRYPEAKALFQEALEILERDWRAHLLDYFIVLNNYATYFIDLGDFATAQQLLERALDLTVVGKKPQKKWAEPAVAVEQVDVVLHLNLVHLFVHMDALPLAAEHLQRAELLFSKLSAREQKASAAFYQATRALVSLERQEMDGAAQQLDQIPDAKYPLGLALRGRLLLARSQCAEAEPLLRQHIDGQRATGSSHRPDLRHTWLDLADCLHGQGKHAEAFAALEEARAISADFQLPPSREWRRAIATWQQRALKLNRHDEAAWLSAELDRLRTGPEHAIIVSDRLRFRPVEG